jgi:hypothetical protein
MIVLLLGSAISHWKEEVEKTFTYHDEIVIIVGYPGQKSDCPNWFAWQLNGSEATITLTTLRGSAIFEKTTSKDNWVEIPDNRCFMRLFVTLNGTTEGFRL